MTLMTVMRMQNVPIQSEASFARAYQATLEMEGVVLVRNQMEQILILKSQSHCRDGAGTPIVLVHWKAF